MKQLEYQLLMAEEGIKLEVLPQEIKDKIKMLKPTVGRYNNTPTDKLKDAITKQDVEIAEMIADYIESDEYQSTQNNNDDDGNGDDGNNGNNDGGNNNGHQNNNSKAEEEAAAAKKAEEEAAAAKKAEEEAAAAAKAAAAKKSKYDFGTEDMEKAILEECNANNGFISEDKLNSIIKRSANYPVQEVYSISLRKVFMKEVYKLQP